MGGEGVGCGCGCGIWGRSVSAGGQLVREGVKGLLFVFDHASWVAGELLCVYMAGEGADGERMG